MFSIIDEGQPTEQIVSMDEDDYPFTIIHMWCCDEDRALCGEDISEDPYVDELDDNNPEQDCVVCVDLDKSTNGCPTCYDL